MEKIKILVVDDESRMRKLVRDFLVREDYEVLEAGDGETALDIFYQEKNIALIILDVMMPKMNGWEVCREIRETSKVPIIMLTAKGDEEDELTGFELGVDEYISKPFSPKILVARVGAILRRSGKAPEEGKLLSIGGIVIDQTAHTVTVDGRQIELSFKEFELLTYLWKTKALHFPGKRFLIMSGTMIISGTPEQSIHMSKNCVPRSVKKEITSKPSGAWVTNLKQKKMAVISNDEKQEKRI